MLEITRRLAPIGPKSVGPFHHAVSAGDRHFVTGRTPTLPDDPAKRVAGGIEEQTRRVMDNLELVLDGLGSGFDRVVFARVYRTYLPEGGLPARTCIGVAGRAVGARVEVDLVAAR